MKKESRAGKLGRFEAAIYNYALMHLIRDCGRKYFDKFMQELGKYSDKPRKRGQPRHGVCVFELEGVDKPDVRDPTLVAKTIKESWHLRYQKDTSRRERNGFLANLKRSWQL